MPWCYLSHLFFCLTLFILKNANILYICKRHVSTAEVYVLSQLSFCQVIKVFHPTIAYLPWRFTVNSIHNQRWGLTTAGLPLEFHQWVKGFATVFTIHKACIFDSLVRALAGRKDLRNMVLPGLILLCKSLFSVLFGLQPSSNYPILSYAGSVNLTRKLIVRFDCPVNMT